MPIAIVFTVRLNILTLRSDMHPSVTQIFPRFLEGGERGPGVKTIPVSCKPPSKHQPLQPCMVPWLISLAPKCYGGSRNREITKYHSSQMAPQ